MWWHGPDWLSQPESTWAQPSSTVTEENKQQIESKKKHKRCETVASAVVAPQPWIDISRYSSLAKLQRIIATIIKASHLFKDASKEVSVTPQLLNQAKLILLRQQRITSQQQNSKSLNSHLHAILQLQPLSGESASQLRQLLVSFEENLMAIEALKLNTKNSDFILVRILSEKLDQDSRRQWELDYPGKNCKHFSNCEIS